MLTEWGASFSQSDRSGLECDHNQNKNRVTQNIVIYKLCFRLLPLNVIAPNHAPRLTLVLKYIKFLQNVSGNQGSSDLL
jgi:hypothetical protein